MKIKQLLFLVLALISVSPFVTPALGLFLGLSFAFACGSVFAKFAKQGAKYLLQASVVGIGCGMNLTAALKAGGGGMAFTILSVALVTVVGCSLGRFMHTDGKIAYLISSGTAICGGSAIAAVAPVVKADDNQVSVALGTIFLLNAIALFVFPPIGHFLGLTEIQFGEWAAIAIHDTSSVVAAGAAYGDQALQTATIIKCTRALWIVPLAFVTTLVYREKGAKMTIPWFIVLFVVAMVVNTFFPLPKVIPMIAKQAMSLTLFLIGSGLSASAVKRVGVRPLILGVVLWAFIACLSLAIILVLESH